MNTVGIHQPNFMPWLGYFYKIWQSDIFIFLDDVQIQKTGASYTNRVSINGHGESQYVTMPLKKDSSNLKINNVKYLDERWKKKLLGTLQGNYAKASFFKENKDFIFDLINFEATNVAEYNINFITQVSKKLKLNTKFIKSSAFSLTSTSTQRLVDLIKKVDGNTYLSGNGGDNYQEKEMYQKENIELTYNKMPKYKYTQLNTEEFISGLSVIDSIFNIGFDVLRDGLFNETY